MQRDLNETPLDLTPSKTSRFLCFCPDSVKNCTIRVNSKHGEAAYEVATSSNLAQTTVTKASQPLPFVFIQRRRFSPDLISIDGGNPFKVKKWVKSLQRFRIFPATFYIGQTTYIWKLTRKGQLVLFKGLSPKPPIAWFQRSIKRMVNNLSSTQPAFLVLQPDAVEIQDSVVISFLLLEYRLRAVAKKTSSVWDILGCTS